MLRIKHLKYKGHPIATIGVTMKDDIYYGSIAICNRADQFAYKIGRQVVTGRLEKEHSVLASLSIDELISFLLEDLIHVHFNSQTQYLNDFNVQVKSFINSFTPKPGTMIVTPKESSTIKKRFLMTLKGQ